jgi:hypothetical protein
MGFDGMRKRLSINAIGRRSSKRHVSQNEEQRRNATKDFVAGGNYQVMSSSTNEETTTMMLIAFSVRHSLQLSTSPIAAPTHMYHDCLNATGNR